MYRLILINNNKKSLLTYLRAHWSIWIGAMRNNIKI